MGFACAQVHMNKAPRANSWTGFISIDWVLPSCEIGEVKSGYSSSVNRGKRSWDISDGSSVLYIHDRENEAIGLDPSPEALGTSSRLDADRFDVALTMCLRRLRRHGTAACQALAAGRLPLSCQVGL